METSTIIVLSVLSTLGVVAIITLVAVSFYKLGRKINALENILFKALEETREECFLTMNKERVEINRQFDEFRREIDSRCDKLDNKIKSSGLNAAGTHINAGNTKQVLQG